MWASAVRAGIEMSCNCRVRGRIINEDRVALRKNLNLSRKFCLLLFRLIFNHIQDEGHVVIICSHVNSLTCPLILIRPKFHLNISKIYWRCSLDYARMMSPLQNNLSVCKVDRIGLTSICFHLLYLGNVFTTCQNITVFYLLKSILDEFVLIYVK